jgi:hypothetical protein
VSPNANPLSIRGGPAAYARLFEKVLDVLGDDFDIAYANRYDGRIETSLDAAHRRVGVTITAVQGGYRIEVRVLRQREGRFGPAGAKVALGRDVALEQAILARLARLDIRPSR